MSSWWKVPLHRVSSVASRVTWLCMFLPFLDAVSVAIKNCSVKPELLLLAQDNDEGKNERVVRVHFALRPQKRGWLLGTGTAGEGDERVKARPRTPPEKDRRNRGPPPEQWKC